MRKILQFFSVFVFVVLPFGIAGITCPVTKKWPFLFIGSKVSKV
jgi:hypothetical protein